MKRCPKCDFTFADVHRVCDFDGSELVDDHEPSASSGKASPLSARFWRVLKSPLFLTCLGLVAVLASALLIGYYDAVSELKSIARNAPSQNSIVSPAPPTTSSVQRPAQIKTPATSSRASALSNSRRTEKSSSSVQRQAIASRSRARLHSPAVASNRSTKSSTAQLREPKEETAHRKEPKLTAMLKTTWRVLKKPFKF